jgi:hypothetical protein
MHPLTTFPNLLDYVGFSPLVLRLSVGIFLLMLGSQRLKRNYSFLCLFYFVFGLTLILGFYTQISAIVTVLLLKIDFYLEYWKNRRATPVPKNYYALYILTSVMTLTLLLTGAGLFALDMPF